MRNHTQYLVVLPFVAALGGCLFETTLDAKGGGLMTATYRVTKADLPGAKRDMQTPAVKLLSGEVVGDGEQSDGVFKIQFDDVTKLSTTRFFHDVAVKRAAGSKPGTTTLSATIKRQTPLKMPDNMVERFGKEVKVVVTFPGDVVESNGTVSGGNTVTWNWGIREFFDKLEVSMTATYKEAAPDAAGGNKAGGCVERSRFSA